MKSEIRIVAIPDEFGGDRYELSTMLYDDEGYLVNVTPIHPFNTAEQVFSFVDQVTKAGMKPVVERQLDGTYDL